MLVCPTSMFSFQDSNKMVAIVEGEAGTWHSIVSPLPSPERVEYTVHTRRVFRRRAIYTPVHPIAVTSNDAEVWRQIVGSAPNSPREYILRAISGEWGKMLRLSRNDANRRVFGTHLKRSETRRNYLSAEGLGFDSFVHNIAIPDYHPEYYEWNSETRGDCETEWLNELDSVVSECQSSKHARSLLIEAYRKAERRHYDEFPPAF